MNRLGVTFKPRGTRLAFSVENILRRAEVTGMRAMRCLLPPVQSTLTRRELSYETPLIGERIHHAEWDGLAGIRTRGLSLARKLRSALRASLSVREARVTRSSAPVLVHSPPRLRLDGVSVIRADVTQQTELGSPLSRSGLR